MNEEKDSSLTVSDEQLIDRLREFLKNSDLNTTTTAIVRRKLEEDFGVDLTDRKGFIRQQVDLFLQTQMEKPAEEEEDDDDVDKEDEQKSKLKSDSKQEQSESDPDTEEEEEEVSSGDEISSNGKGRKKSVKNKDVKKKAVGGFSKLCSLSPELQNVLGAPEMPRTEVVKQIWKYIQARDLQDPSNRKNIRCDEALRAVFKVDIIGMLQMNKALTRHIWPLGSDAAPDPSTVKEKPPKEKTKKRKKREDPEDSQSKEKRVNCSGFLAPYPLSDALIKFIGTGESAMPRASVVKLIWGYIKEHNLQDPSDKKTILCDEKLKELFNVESFVGFTVPRLLKDHFIKAQPSQ